MNRKWIWGILFLFLVLIAYIVPYTFLTDIQAWYGSFLFWILIALVIVVFNYIVTWNWRK
mgnify:CR=1 FL=1